jgi:hypothetical protein
MGLASALVLRSAVNPGLERWALGIFGGFLGTLGLGWAFFGRRSQGFDDLALFNPPYMYLHYGTVTYPALGQFDSMTVHPPTHYWILGTLMKTGLAPFYAEAVPPVVFLLVAIWFIWRSEWSTPIKAGLLVGLSVPFLSGDFAPRMRPEPHFSLAWYAGLLALESGRLKGWGSGQLLIGSTLLAYASILQYPVAPACLGILVYLVWVVRDKGLRNSPREAVVLLSGPVILAVAYLGFFVIPHWQEILASISTSRTGSPIVSVHAHVKAYDAVYARLTADKLSITLLPLRAGVPVILIAAAVLGVFRETRGIAIASLPYPLFLLLVMSRKSSQPGYYMPELMLYFASIGILVCVIAQWFVGILTTKRSLARALAPVAAGGLLAATPGAATVLASLDLSTIPTLHRRHEAAVARAAARTILGPEALVGSRNAAMFYASGATHYLDVALDLLVTSRLPHHLTAYFADFDALVEHQAFSYLTWNEKRESLVSWYLTGLLRLRGFYMSATTDWLSYLLLNSRGARQIEGYARLGDQSVLRFLGSSDGAYRFLALRCVGVAPVSLGIGEILRTDYPLPGVPPMALSGWLVALLIGAKDFEAARMKLPQRCVVHQEIPMSLERVEEGRLLEALATDPPIRFFADRDSAMHARHGPEMALQDNKDGWPDVLRFVRGPRIGRVYRVAPEEGRVLFRAMGDTPSVWQVYTYGPSGGLRPNAQGPSPDNRVLAYSGNDPRDHLTTPFLETLPDEGSLVLFTIWLKPEDARKLPSVYVQDDSFTRLATAREVQQRPDGWRLLAGWWPARTGGKFRLVVTHQGRGNCLIDKAMLATMWAVK